MLNLINQPNYDHQNLTNPIDYLTCVNEQNLLQSDLINRFNTYLILTQRFLLLI